MIWLFFGKDNFRKQLQIRSLKTKLVDPGMESMNFQELSNPSTPDLINNLQTPAWGSTNKLILVTGLPLLEGAPKPEELETVLKELRSLILVLQNLSNNIHVIFALSNLDQRLKVFKEFKKELPQLELQDFKEFSPWDTKTASQWLLTAYSDINNGARLDPIIAEYFVEFIGTEDCSKLYNELIRLNALGKELNIELINSECIAQHNIFKYALDLAAGNNSKAFIQLESMIRNKEIHPGTLAAIETTILRYLKLKLAQKAGLGKDEKASILGVSPQALYHKEKEVQNLSIARLEQLNQALLKAEHNSKTGRMNTEDAFRILTAL